MIDNDVAKTIVLVMLGSAIGVFIPLIIGHFWPYGL